MNNQENFPNSAARSSGEPASWILPIIACCLFVAASLTSQGPIGAKPASDPESESYQIPVQLRQRAAGSSQLELRKHRSAIEAGLNWLREHQDEDGRWDCDEFAKHDSKDAPTGGEGNAAHDVGVTALALLAFLAEGSSPDRGEYAPVIRNGLRWIGEQQDQETGLIGGDYSPEFIYSHAIASLALVEAYALTGDEFFAEQANAAIKYLEHHRNPPAVWRYQPRDSDNDLSVTYWCASVYLIARWAGLEIKDIAVFRIQDYVTKSVDPISGRAGYTTKSKASSRRSGQHGEDFPRRNSLAMTAAALDLKYKLGMRPHEDLSMTASAFQIESLPPFWDEEDKTIDQYYWMVGAQALHQYGRGEWQRWSKTLYAMLIAEQRTANGIKGSWDPAGPWGQDGGRIYSTAICLLALQAEYRYAAFNPVPDRAPFEQAHSHWRAAEFDKVSADLGKLARRELPPEDAKFREALEMELAAEIAGAELRISSLLKDDPVPYTIINLERVQKEFGKLEPGKLARDHVKRLSKDAKLKREADAWRLYRDLFDRFDRTTPKGQRAMLRELPKLIKKYEGTAMADSARSWLRYFERKQGK